MNRLVITLVLLLAGCGLFGGGLASRAADYYAYMLGHGKDVKYSSFLSPVYRESFSRDGLANLNSAMRKGNIQGGRIPPVKARDINVFREANFYVTTVKPEAGEGYEGISLTRWIKVGSGWYLYNGSEAEIEAYGHFPDTLLAQANAPAEPEGPGSEAGEGQ